MGSKYIEDIEDMEELKELKDIINFGNIRDLGFFRNCNDLNDDQKTFLISMYSLINGYQIPGEELRRTPNISSIEELLKEYCQKFMN